MTEVLDAERVTGCIQPHPNVRLPIELIDWVDDLVKQGSRDQNKSRIPKEVWFQAALELFQSMPIDWDDISDEDELRDVLNTLESRFLSL